MLKQQVGTNLIEWVQHIGIGVGRKGTRERTMGTWKVTNRPIGMSVRGTHPPHSFSTTKYHHEVRWPSHSLILRGIPRSGLKVTNELKGGKMTWDTFNLFR